MSAMDLPRIGMTLGLAAEDDLRWHRDVSFLERALATLAESGIELESDRMEVNFEEMPFDGKKLAKAVAAKKTAMVGLFTKAGAHVTIHAGGILAEVSVWKIVPSEATIDGLITWARAVAKLPEGRARVRSGTIYPISLWDLERQRSVEHDFVRLRVLADFFGPAWVSEKAPDVAEAALEATLPEATARIRDEELVALRWATDPRTTEDLAEACVRQEDWWRAHVDMTLNGGWAGERDMTDFPTTLEPGTPFTLVNRANHTGYRAVLVRADGTLDGATWSELAKLTEMRQLADGSPIERVRLIIPARENAVAIAARARELGIDEVLYRGDGPSWKIVAAGNGSDAPRPLPKPRGRKC
ncbi:MAG: hypothetical protein KF901_33790 [Myxococcales bacterium]|nr:hypothetical protein [Myxococcales bacterium]